MIIHQLRKTKNVRDLINLFMTIMTIVNTICYIIVVNFNHNISGNLSIDLVSEILSFTDWFQQSIKFRHDLQAIEDGTICILQSPNMESFSISPATFQTKKIWCLRDIIQNIDMKAHHDIVVNTASFTNNGN